MFLTYIIKMIYKFDYEYVSYEELYKAYIDCRKRKRTTVNALKFEINENIELYKLWIDLNTQKYEIGKSIVFCVEKPVKREVFAADFRDRIVHHLIINMINDILEDEFIDDSYSCRKGKGTDYGIRKCAEYLNEITENYTKECYIMKCDLKSFFMTIDKTTLYNKLTDFITSKYNFNDKRKEEFIFRLIWLIIFNEPQKNCIMKQSWSHWDDLPKSKSLFFCQSGKGLPIGNLTSQIFANFYLSEFDHYVKEILNIKYYGRYVDDFFFIAESKKEIKEILKHIRIKLEELGAQLHPKKLYIQKSHKGIKFVGAVIRYNRIYISNRTKGEFYWSIKRFNSNLDRMYDNKREPTQKDLEHFIGSINSYLGFMVHYKTYNIRKKIIKSDIMKRWWKYCYTNINLTKLCKYKISYLSNGA